MSGSSKHIIFVLKKYRVPKTTYFRSFIDAIFVHRKKSRIIQLNSHRNLIDKINFIVHNYLI